MAERIRSPYRPGMGLDPPYLGDREEQLARFRDFLTEPEAAHNILVTGLRGVGKTVLLNYYSDEAESAGWLVADREWSQNDASPDLFRQLVLEDLVRLTLKLSVAERVRTLGEGLVKRLRNVLGGLGIAYEGVEVRYEAREARAVSRRLDDELRELLVQVGKLCRTSDSKGVILCYDEFHVVEEKRGTTTLSALLAAVAAAQQQELPVMLILCGLPPIVEHLVNAKNYSERMFTPERLANLRQDEARAALVDPARAHGRAFEEPVVAAVLQDTQGYPYFLQLYGDRLWKGSPRDTITGADFERLRPAVLRDLDDMFFEGRYQRATRRERAVLHAISASGEESATVKQIVEKGQIKNNELQPLLANLVGKGLIFRPGRGVIAFTAPMFGAYLRRTDPH
ncbi:MAG: ATP-binding protein [Chloroflexi bacterium]|nr:ATP-binding protein [Chloroflexota bacterium]